MPAAAAQASKGRAQQPPQLGPIGAEIRRLRLGALLLSAAEASPGSGNPTLSPGDGGCGGGTEFGGLHYGEAYVYCAGALAARLGHPLAAQLPAVQRLCASMRCALAKRQGICTLGLPPGVESANLCTPPQALAEVWECREVELKDSPGGFAHRLPTINRTADFDCADSHSASVHLAAGR